MSDEEIAAEVQDIERLCNEYEPDSGIGPKIGSPPAPTPRGA